MSKYKHKFRITQFYVDQKPAIHAHHQPLPITDYKVGFTLDREIRSVEEFFDVMDALKEMFKKEHEHPPQ